MADNAFLDPSFTIPWSQLTPEKVSPAIEEALARAEAAVSRVASQPLDRASFESTFLGLEKATEELGRAWGKVTHLQSVNDSPALREAHNAMLPKVSSFYARIPLNADLWARLKAAAGQPASKALTGVRKRFLNETMLDFVQAGADLGAEQKGRLEALQAELAQVTQKFSENELDATNGWQLVVEDESRLKGLPEHAKAAARRSASAKGLGSEEKPAWRFTLQAPSMLPFMTYLEDEALRKQMYEAASKIGAVAPFDNTPLIETILTLRAEKAALLGRANFADLVLERRMARSGQKALAFVDEFRDRAMAAFRRDAAELEAFRTTQTGGKMGHLAPWELLFWAEKLRKSAYDFDEEVLRPYFPMDRVVAGLFELARRVFGLTIVERPQVEAWAPLVQYYDMTDARGVHVGSFFADWYPRESKRSGAWMGSLITGGPDGLGKREPHLGHICGNMTPPSEGKTALLNHREVETIFHEFGHLIHHLLGEVEIKSLNGTQVAWDFVELPSQIMENWCWERESLDLFARHHETGLTIPEEIFAKMTAARNFRSATFTMRQVAFGKMDLLMHLRSAEFIGGDVEPKIRAAIGDCLIPTEPPAPTIVKRFNHLFSDPVGYAAGYYSYKWAEVLDADAFTRFRREGIFNPAVGRAFIDAILSRGNSEDPAVLFREFMGRDPDVHALLVRSGLAA